MCLGIPMRVVESHGLMARCAGRGIERWLDLALVGAQPAGTWLLAFIDTAREVIDLPRAALINDALDALEAALEGEMDLSAHFADLLNREPELPEHLRGVPS
jgi:hydrogenase expression/formation protein HypC